MVCVVGVWGRGLGAGVSFYGALRNDCFVPENHFAMPLSRGRCGFCCQQVCVAGESPASVGVFAQDGERVAGAVHGGAAVRRRDGHADTVAEVGPVAYDLDFLDVVGALKLDVLHAFGGCGEHFLAEGRLAGGHEDYVVGY